MNFEDIVDMDWLDSHTTDSCLPSPPSSLIEDIEMCNHNMDLLLYPSADANSAALLPMMDDNVATSAAHIASTSCTNEPQAMVMPSTEQIKQLIELAKRQLALREQQQQQLVTVTAEQLFSTTPEPESPLTTIKLEDLNCNINLSQNTTCTISPESLNIKEEAIPMSPSRRESSVSETEGPMSLEAYAETDGIDIKKLTSKERRQLRNKISARNFRVRRKEYITTLEGQVDDHKKANEHLLHRLNNVEDENKQLKLQIDSLKRQNQLLQKPNINKDLSILGSSASDTYRQDTSILVS